MKQFAPSEWADVNKANDVIQLFRKLKTPAFDKVNASGTEYTLFTTGVSVEYFAPPQNAKSSLSSLSVGVDFNKGEANFVGMGDEPFCLTLAEDMGRFVAAALDLDKWDERLGTISSRTTWNKLIKLGEKVRGKKFIVNRTTVDVAISKLDPNPANPFTNFMLDVYIALCQGEYDFQATLNQKYPGISPMTIEEFVNKWWGGKEGQIF